MSQNYNYLNELQLFLEDVRSIVGDRLEKHAPQKLHELLLQIKEPSVLTDGELALNHVLCHMFYPHVKRGRLKAITEEQIFKCHANIINETINRGRSHGRVDRFDDDTETFIKDKDILLTDK